MTNQVKSAIMILDFVLIMMTATWIIITIFRGLDFLEIGYLYLYLIINAITLVLNLRMMNKKIKN